MGIKREGNAPQTTGMTPFGPVHVFGPLAAGGEHTHTAVLLHGRGSSGPEFAEELLGESRLADQTTLAQRLPTWRWVFPSAPARWSALFQEDLPAWFEVQSLADPTARQDLQRAGIADSVRYVRQIVAEEAARLGGRHERIVLGGISQGAAIGMWTLLCGCGEETTPRQVGAFVGSSTWLPFADGIEHLLAKEPSERDNRTFDEAEAFVESIMRTSLREKQTGASIPPVAPVFLGHGVDDAVVDVHLGRQARDVLRNIGLNVLWKEYMVEEAEGHWLKVPEQVEDIAAFLESCAQI